MATKDKTFVAFGQMYKTRQFAAIPALEIMSSQDTFDVVENLRLTEVLVEDRFVSLYSRAAINEYVKDSSGAMPPRLVLQGLLKVVNDFSFGFARGWRGVKIPSRFTGGSEPRRSAHVDPLIGNLLQERAATLQELETYYSLSDAFSMFDVIVAKGVNEAVAQEAASKGKA